MKFFCKATDFTVAHGMCAFFGYGWGFSLTMIATQNMGTSVTAGALVGFGAAGFFHAYIKKG